MFEYEKKPGEPETVRAPREAKKNRTGIPSRLKERIERESGLSLDDVQVHYNSGKPSGLGALAYTQGSQVYVGPGQERHLGHELGHVVQQKLGKVRADTTINGMPVNTDKALEQEADRIGGCD